MGLHISGEGGLTLVLAWFMSQMVTFVRGGGTAKACVEAELLSVQLHLAHFCGR